MKQLILNALKAKFEGVSESILSRIADKLSKTTTSAEQVKDVIDGVTIQQVIDGYADSRATEASQTAVHNYEQKHGLKDGKKVEKPSEPVKPKPEGGEDVPSWVQNLIESNKALMERVAKIETDRTTTTRREQLSGVISKLPSYLKKAYERTPLDGLSDEEFKNLINDVTSEVEGYVKDTQQKGVIFGKPTHNNKGGSRGTEKEATDEEVDAVADRLNI